MLTLEMPDNIFSALHMSPAAFVREMRVAAAEEKGVASPLTQFGRVGAGAKSIVPLLLQHIT